MLPVTTILRPSASYGDVFYTTVRPVPPSHASLLISNSLGNAALTLEVEWSVSWDNISWPAPFIFRAVGPGDCTCATGFGAQGPKHSQIWSPVRDTTGSFWPVAHRIVVRPIGGPYTYGLTLVEE